MERQRRETPADIWKLTKPAADARGLRAIILVAVGALDKAWTTYVLWLPHHTSTIRV